MQPQASIACIQKGHAVKIFEIGLGRTGTRSLAEAARILGFNSIHGLRAYEWESDYDYRMELQSDYMQKVSLGQVDFRVCDEFDYIGHIGAPFFQQLDAEYPGSKFIFTVRERTPWLASFRIDKVTKRTQELLDRFSNGEINYPILWRLLLYGSVKFDAGRLEAAMVRQVQAVGRYFRDRDNLLIFQTGSGWDKLCPFLDVPIPDEDFPWIKRGSATRA